MRRSRFIRLFSTLMSVNPPPRGKPIDIEELKRLKQAKKEAKKALNQSKPPPPPPPKPLRRDFIRVNDQGHRHPIRVMSFNVREFFNIYFISNLSLSYVIVDLGSNAYQA